MPSIIKGNKDNGTEPLPSQSRATESAPDAGRRFEWAAPPPRGVGFFLRDFLPIAALYETSADSSQSLCKWSQSYIGRFGSDAVQQS